MELNDYQSKAKETAIYPDIGNNITYPALGLAGEAGEVANKVKKVIRDDKGIINEKNRVPLVQELGDALWYVAQLGTELGVSLEKIAEENLKKLALRKEQNVLKGSGDER